MTTDLKTHAAVAAWAELGFNGHPSSVERLPTLKGKGSLVYRLCGIGNSQKSVIAKYAPRESILTERFAYQDVLPRVPVTRLQCYGFLEANDGHCWLFLEDACGEQFSEFRREHVALASEWVGMMHATTAREHLGSHLPTHGSDYYLHFILETRRIVSETLKCRTLSVEDVSLLERLLYHCDELELRWAEMWSYCEALPKCLLHGDLINKNIRVRNVDGRLVLYVIDWEAASWSAPTEDIAGLDMEIYFPIVRETWPSLDLETVRRAADIGSVLKYAAWMEGYSAGFLHPYIADTLDDLRYCEAELAAARRKVKR